MHHPVIVIAVWRVRNMAVLRGVHLHGGHMRGSPRSHVMRTVLEMERQLVLMRYLRDNMLWVRSS